MKWTTTQLIAIGSISVLLFLVELPGTFISNLLGIPGAGGLATGILFPIFFIFNMLMVPKFGSATLMGFIYGILILPIPASGPPGFVGKILLWVAIGLFGDTIWGLFKQKTKLAAMITAGISATFALASFVIYLQIFQIPGAEKSISLFTKPVVIFVIFLIGLFGGLFGYLLFQKLANTAVIKRIQGIT